MSRTPLRRVTEARERCLISGAMTGESSLCLAIVASSALLDSIFFVTVLYSGMIAVHSSPVLSMSSPSREKISVS